MGHDTLAIPDVLKKKRDALKTKRDSLFKEYTSHPNDHRLALEIKTIDDEIAECVRKEQESFKRPKLKVSPTSALPFLHSQ